MSETTPRADEGRPAAPDASGGAPGREEGTPPELESPVAERPDLADPLSAMTPRFNVFFRWFARRFFRHFDLDDKTVARLRQLEERGTVIYVMRYSSRLDYFLFNTLFRREGLRLSSFANGLRFYYYRPLWQALKPALFRPRGRPAEVAHSEECGHAARLAQSGQSFFLFLRTRRLRNFVRGRRRARKHDELDLLEEVVRAVWDGGQPVTLVPTSIFWRKGPRSDTRFLNLSYGSLTRPSDVAKVTSFLATYRDLSVKLGEPIDLRAFISDQRAAGEKAVARKIRRSILIYLYREEKVVEGPTIQPQHRVLDAILADSGVRRAIATRAEERKTTLDKAEQAAEKMFREIAANQNSTFLAILGLAVSVIFRRIFSSIEVDGLEKVAEYAKKHPLVLVPTHRSYFDFLILSWLFYRNYLVPPHIAAGDNMGFGPFGFIFRRAGAYFLRRTFDDDLYKEVFRAYVAYLVREGFTQEFFIEGGRSRTGRTLTPRLGILSWNVEAFLEGARRDLFLVPIAITYERLVEESSMVGELSGEAKQKESVLGLVRARKILQRRFGSVTVSFGEPLSLADALGDRRTRFAHARTPEVEAEKREFVDSLGHRLVERINRAVAANSTAVASAVLMGSSHRGILRRDLVERMQVVVDLLRLQDVSITPALARDEGEFQESIAFLLRSDLIGRAAEPSEEILYFDESRRRALDIYRNAIVHYLAVPSLLARRLLRGASTEALREDLAFWTELLYQEYFLPRGEVLAAQFDAFLDWFETHGWIESQDGAWVASDRGRRLFPLLDAQTRGVLEAYYALFCAVRESLDVELPVREICTRAAAQFEQMALLGRLSHSEAMNDTTFRNALERLVQQQVLSRRVERGRRSSTTHYARGERSEELAPLIESVAGALFHG
ncbi:MAG: 1-acyl-sn-glycerol-3-phosphate acyltransferase [Proteobacteria bacterium]|nr:1-acyl-sn-glycerol-3-phosphate acyltransferase [Pseudomonadota bacterium]